MAKYEMVRGDYRELFVMVPQSGYQSGSTLFFVVKQALDNDTDDSDAVFQLNLTDADIVDSAFSLNGETYIRYRGVITSDMTNTYAMTSKKIKLIAEFQYVVPGVKPTTYPQFDFILYKDANRRRTI